MSLVRKASFEIMQTIAAVGSTQSQPSQAVCLSVKRWLLMLNQPFLQLDKESVFPVSIYQILTAQSLSDDSLRIDGTFVHFVSQSFFNHDIQLTTFRLKSLQSLNHAMSLSFRIVTGSGIILVKLTAFTG